MRPPDGGTAGWAGAAVRSRDRHSLHTVPQPGDGHPALRARSRPRGHRRLHARRPGGPAPRPARRHPPPAAHAAGPAAAQAALFADDGDRSQHRRARVVGPDRQRRPLPQPPRLRHLDLPPLGGDNGSNGPLLTKTLLIYCLTAGGTNNGPRLVAYDKTDGTELASVDLPSGGIGTPMTYLVDGRQYIALTIGEARGWWLSRCRLAGGHGGKPMAIFVTDRISLAEDRDWRAVRACARTRRAERQQARKPRSSCASMRAGRRRLPDDVRTRLLELAGARATKHGEILINAHRFRTRERNREDARERLVSLVRRATVVAKTRRATRPSLASTRRQAEIKAPPRTAQARSPATRPGLRPEISNPGGLAVTGVRVWRSRLVLWHQ